MSFINQFPYSDFHELNLDWIIRTVKALEAELKDFKAVNQMTFEGTWNITKQYKPYSIVFDYDTGYSYISKVPVPAGVIITNNDYWMVIGPLIIDAQARQSIDQILHFICNIYEGGSTATALRSTGDYIIWSGDLFKVTQTINTGEYFTVGYNIEHTTIENMIDDQFPIGSDKIATGAVTTGKLASGAVTTAKIADHSVNKAKMVTDKYLFIGDSYNKDYHYSWGEKVAARLGLTLNSNYWISATSGGSMGNGLILTDVTTLAGTMSTAEKESITKIALVFGVNDWQYSEIQIKNGTEALETFLVTNFPNADIVFCAAQWGYYNDTYRQGVIRAYNTYAATFKKIRFVDKAYIMMMNPAVIDADMVHPTDGAASDIATVVINALNGGGKWTYVSYGMSASIDTTGFGGNSSDVRINGMITEAGTHIWRKAESPVFFSPALPITDSYTQIGTIQAANNNFFQREAVIKGPFKAAYRDQNNVLRYGMFYGALKIKKHSDADSYWDVYIQNEQYIEGSYNISIANIAIQFDTLLDFTQT